MDAIRHTGHHGATLIVGTTKSDTLTGGLGVADIRGWAGDDILHGGVRGGTVSGGHGNDIIYAIGFGARMPQQFQTHAFGDWGNDTIIMDLSRQTGDTYALRFGHHVFGGHGKDKFVFSGSAKNDQRIIGRIDDFDPSQDTIWIDNQQINFRTLPENVRVVGYKGQQWLLINEKALYCLEGARHDSEKISGDGRNAEGSEEDHFIDWPEEWLNGVPKTADIPFQDPVNFVPDRYLRGGDIYVMFRNSHDATVMATSSNDRIEGSADQDQIIYGYAGNDFIWSNREDDTVLGGAGDDYIDGYHGHDRLYGGTGDDTVDGGKGHDVIHGGYGNDVLASGSDNDTIFGGSGNDTIFGGSEDDLIYGDDGNDILWGGPEDDRIFGGSGHDNIQGSDGNDKLVAAGGNDTIHGGEGNDWLLGGTGNDILRGGAGKDIIVGEAGSDRLYSGIGQDSFVFTQVSDSKAGVSIDRIMDFHSSQDLIDLSRFDANTVLAGHQDLTFAQGPQANSVWLSQKSDGTYVRIDVDGDGRQDFAVVVERALGLSIDNFVF